MPSARPIRSFSGRTAIITSVLRRVPSSLPRSRARAASSPTAETLVNVEVSGNKLLHPSYLVDGNYYDYDYTKFVQAYTNVVNSDGVVPLTEEFADFLKDYAERAGYPEAPEDPYAEAIEGYGWYLFLYYYDAEVKDFEEGKGTEADPYVISETGVYGHTLTLNDQTYVFRQGLLQLER